ncbi:MAG TPA: PilZ domain-containing protein [Polyangia bacterium]|nr:PilZ domain-containing protein [Polyangia bacterium]
MKQSRRVSPRIPYDEAVCLARVDGKGRLFGRSVDLGPAGIYVTCAELCEIGTELLCTVLLPGGPRRLRGRVVRLVALPRAVGIAVKFVDLREADRLVIERLVASRRPEAQAVKLRVDGLDHELRAEATLDAGERTMRVSTSLPPFLRLDADVGVVIDGASPDGATGAANKRGVIRRIAVDPAPRADGVPRLALDVDLGAAPSDGPAAPELEERPPSGLPRPYRHPLPSVLLSTAFARQIASDVPTAAAPQRRRSHGTAEIARRFTDAGALVLAAAGDRTHPVMAGHAPAARALSPAWLAVPIMLATLMLALFGHFAR